VYIAEEGLMNSQRAIAAIVLLAAAITPVSPLSAQARPPQAATSCAPTNGLSFVCGAQNPEDLVPIPGTRWLIASGLKDGAGLKLIDTDAKTARLFYTGRPAQQRPDKKLFPNCPAPPDANTFNAHGLYLRRAQAPGLYRLYVVSHGLLESIQVFAVDVSSAEPSLTWTGCVPMPKEARLTATSILSRRRAAWQRTLLRLSRMAPYSPRFRSVLVQPMLSDSGANPRATL